MASSDLDVFVSYKRRTRDRIVTLVGALRSLHLNVWYDAHMEAGRPFDAEIADNVRRAKCVLVCWTPDAFAKGGDETGWVRAEARIGRDRNVLVSAYFEACELDPPFNIDQTEDLTGWEGDEQQEGYLKVLDRIGALCGRPGLREFVEIRSSGAADRITDWADRYPDDPLAVGVLSPADQSVVPLSRSELEGRLLNLEAALEQSTGLPSTLKISGSFLSRGAISANVVDVVLVNGVRLRGRIAGFDGHTVLIRDEKNQRSNLIYLGAIAQFVTIAQA